jgi:hypothetical protein
MFGGTTIISRPQGGMIFILTLLLGLSALVIWRAAGRKVEERNAASKESQAPPASELWFFFCWRCWSASL